MAETASTLPTVQRQLYEPDNAKEWWDEETMLVRVMEEENKEAEEALEPEPVGVDALLVQNGFAETLQPGGDQELAARTTVSIDSRVKPGYDLVRVGNIKSIAFFHHRTAEFTASRRVFVEACIDILFDVSTVFSYNPRYVTLFYQPNSVSRFIRQQLLFNLWPIESHQQAQRIADVRTDPFAYLYLYGLFIHKIAHFHDIVHGTRHDFFMDELRIETMRDWLQLLERKGFDPSSLNTSDLGTKFLRLTVF
jgi:hypothetical protein